MRIHRIETCFKQYVSYHTFWTKIYRFGQVQMNLNFDQIKTNRF